MITRAYVNMPLAGMTATVGQPLGSDMIDFVLKSPLYKKLVDEDFCFRLANIRNYNLNQPATCYVEFHFRRLDDDDKVLLVMRDSFSFTPDPDLMNVHDIDRRGNGIDTGSGWENVHRLLPNFKNR